MSVIKHGLYGTRLYRTWNGMKYRCLNKKSKDYKFYGEKGITICEEWLDSSNFFKWALDNGYADNLTIDRIDNDKGYSPENCRWITNAEQQRNRNFNKNITYNGVTKCIAEWSRETGLARQTIQNRLDSGWDVERTLTTRPLNKGGKRKNESKL